MLRLVEVSVPTEDADALQALLAEQELIGSWPRDVLGEILLTRLLLRTERAEPLLDLLQQRFGYREEFRAVLVRVHATVPEVKTAEKPPATEDLKPEPPPPQRVARAEIRNELEAGIDIGPVFLATVVLSATIAAIGLLRNNVAVIIGAMVVAPLLTPNMAVAFAVTVGDLTFARKAARTALIGMGVAFVLALLIGAITPAAWLGNPEIVSRTQPHPLDLLLALASGAAGALAFTSGVSASLVGVMVAVALLPPLIVSGLMAADLQWERCAGALLLLAINTICVILAGVGTFAWRGVSPRTWWEKDKARRYTRRMTTACIALALVLLGLAFVANRHFG